MDAFRDDARKGSASNQAGEQSSSLFAIDQMSHSRYRRGYMALMGDVSQHKTRPESSSPRCL